MRQGQSVRLPIAPAGSLLTLPDTERRQLLRDVARSPAGAWVTCVSGSMEPTIQVGQKVRVRATRRPRIGDVVVFETGSGDGYMLHRVLLTLPIVPWFIHGGDAVPRGEPGIAHRRQLIGTAEVPHRRPDALVLLRAIRRAARAAARTFVLR